MYGIFQVNVKCSKKMIIIEKTMLILYLSLGNEVRHNLKLLNRSMASLEWLRIGDRITLELTANKVLRILLNSEDMNISFPNVSTVIWKYIFSKFISYFKL